MSFAQIVVSCALLACASAPQTTTPAKTEATTEQLIRLRCATDGRETITTWTGRMEGRAPGEPAKPLFRVVGMNIARCVQIRNRWYLTSRELMYYLDLDTGEVLHTWTNPWTGKIVPVVHVANELVQNELRGPVPFTVANDTAMVIFDIDVAYPNPIARNAQLSHYSPQTQYRANEHFELSTPMRAFADPTIATVPSLDLRWLRTGPWLPWMDMGDRAGELAYETEGRRVARIEDLPALVRDDIQKRLPLFAHAPRCLTAGRNQTSWTYFVAHIDAYQRGERFPVSAPVRDEQCVEELKR